MIIYKDMMSGDELFSDSYPIEYLGEGKHIMQVQGELTTERSTIDESKIGANASAEQGAEAMDDDAVSGIDIVIANRLVETTGMSLKEYKKKIRAYMKILTEKRTEQIQKLEADGKTEDAEKAKEKFASFKKHMPGTLSKYILDPWKEKDFQFFMGESLDDDAMTPLLFCPEDHTKPVMYFFTYGLQEMKV